MAIAIALVLLVVGTVAFHFLSPWWFTPIASNWSMVQGGSDLEPVRLSVELCSVYWHFLLLVWLVLFALLLKT